MTSKNTEVSHSEEPSPWIDLPIEIWQEIISYLGVADLKQLRLTSRFFNEIVRIPLISQSKMLIAPGTIEKVKREFLQNQQFWPFHTIQIREISFNEDLRNILEKCTTKYLQSFKIWDAKVFEWLAMKPMPTLKELDILWSWQDFPPLIFPKDWQLEIYKNLKKLSIIFLHQESSTYKELLRQLCDAGAKLPLRELYVSYSPHDDFVNEISMIFDTDNCIALDPYEKIFRGRNVMLNGMEVAENQFKNNMCIFLIKQRKMICDYGYVDRDDELDYESDF